MTEQSPEPGREVAVRQNASMLERATDSWLEMAGPVFRLAAQIADTEFVPKGLQGNPPAVAAAILHGRELGLGPMTALAQTHVIEGRPSLSAEGQRGLVLAAGHEIEILESTGAVCTIRGRRKGSERWTTVAWSIDMARAANLLNKSNWKNYPRSMLLARASAELCKAIFADVVHGMGATEELEDLADTNGEVSVESTSKVSRAPRPEPAPRKRAELPPRKDEPAPEPGAAEATPAAPEPPVDEPPAATPEPSEPQKATQPPERPSPPVSGAQLRMLGVNWNRLGVTDDLERRTFTGLLVGRDIGDTTKNLNVAEAIGLIDRLTKIKDREHLEQVLRDIDQPAIDAETGEVDS